MSPSDTRQKLIDAMANLVDERSYSDVGVAEICKAAGVQKGSFYHFFPSKRDLAIAMLGQYQAFWDSYLEEEFSKVSSPIGRLQIVLDALFTFELDKRLKCGHTSGCRMGNIAQQMATHDEVIKQVAQEFFNDTREALSGLLTEAMHAGEMIECDADSTALAILAYTQGILLINKAYDDPEMIRFANSSVLALLKRVR